jgi:signal transduction histidine kinase
MKREILGFMRRARPRLNLWLLLVLFLSLGTFFAAANVFRSLGRANARLLDVAGSLCEVARTAYESGGRNQLSLMAGTLARLGAQPYLFDQDGTNLAGGENRSSLLAVRRTLGPIPVTDPRDPRVTTQAGAYSCVVVGDLNKEGINPRRGLWVLPFLSILCCTVAWYVTLRMRRIEAVVTHFGSGELGARVTPDSGDPIGRLSRAFNEMADRIESLVGAHRRLCIDISHELRSPLARLRLAVGLARSQTRGALDRIEMESDRLNDLVNELLEVARAEVDPGALHVESIDLQFLLNEVGDTCSIEAEDRGCNLDFKFFRAGSVMGDPELLRRAIENVLRNAIRHSPACEPIELMAGGDANMAVISIRDRGPGVPDGALQNIFQPFFRVETDRGRQTGGAGLGLAIAERAIAVHKGSVKAENSEPGLRVEIRLPRQS